MVPTRWTFLCGQFWTASHLSFCSQCMSKEPTAKKHRAPAPLYMMISFQIWNVPCRVKGGFYMVRQGWWRRGNRGRCWTSCIGDNTGSMLLRQVRLICFPNVTILTKTCPKLGAQCLSLEIHYLRYNISLMMECSVQCIKIHAYDWSFKLYTPSCKNLASFSVRACPKNYCPSDHHSKRRKGAIRRPNVS